MPSPISSYARPRPLPASLLPPSALPSEPRPPSQPTSRYSNPGAHPGHLLEIPTRIVARTARETPIDYIATTTVVLFHDLPSAASITHGTLPQPTTATPHAPTIAYLLPPLEPRP